MNLVPFPLFLSLFRWLLLLPPIPRQWPQCRISECSEHHRLHLPLWRLRYHRNHRIWRSYSKGSMRREVIQKKRKKRTKRGIRVCDRVFPPVRWILDPNHQMEVWRHFQVIELVELCTDGTYMIFAPLNIPYPLSLSPNVIESDFKTRCFSQSICLSTLY